MAGRYAPPVFDRLLPSRLLLARESEAGPILGCAGLELALVDIEKRIVLRRSRSEALLRERLSEGGAAAAAEAGGGVSPASGRRFHRPLLPGELDEEAAALRAQERPHHYRPHYRPQPPPSPPPSPLPLPSPSPPPSSSPPPLSPPRTSLTLTRIFTLTLALALTLTGGGAGARGRRARGTGRGALGRGRLAAWHAARDAAPLMRGGGAWAPPTRRGARAVPGATGMHAHVHAHAHAHVHVTNDQLATLQAEARGWSRSLHGLQHSSTLLAMVDEVSIYY